MDTRSSDETWAYPVEIIPLPSGYDFRRYAEYAPFILCKDGRPIEVQGKYGNWWRPCIFDPAGDELKEFAEAMRMGSKS